MRKRFFTSAIIIIFGVIFWGVSKKRTTLALHESTPDKQEIKPTVAHSTPPENHNQDSNNNEIRGSQAINKMEFESTLKNFLELPNGSKYADEWNRLFQVLNKQFPLEFLSAFDSRIAEFPPNNINFIARGLGNELGRLDVSTTNTHHLSSVLAFSGPAQLKIQILKSYGQALAFRGADLTPALALATDNSTKQSLLVGYISKLNGGLNTSSLEAINNLIPFDTFPVKDQSDLANAILKGGEIGEAFKTIKQMGGSSSFENRILLRWLNDDSDECLTYLNGLTKNDRYDDYIVALLPALVGIDPTAADTWAGTITDKQKREAILQKLSKQLQKK